MDRRRVVLLGSTGSIGTQALDIVARNPDRFEVVALAAGGGHVAELAAQVLAVRPQVVAVSRSTVIEDLQLALYAEAAKQGYDRGGYALPRLVSGPDAMTEAAALDCDLVLNAITGAAGLTATLAALGAGRHVALANKESLVIGGRLVTGRARPGQLFPVDSEHTALAQCLRAGSRDEVRKLVITASGGPFLERSRADLADVTPEQALRHPNFAMGPVITINSATLVNKGLEVIEAQLLFDVPMDDIEVVVHPQQAVHAMVEFADGSTIAQAGPPSMLQPIAMALGWPDRVPDAGPRLDWTRAADWHFEPLDDEAFPAVSLARRVGAAGGIAPATYNAANEVAVQAFREGRLPFTGIVDVIDAVVDRLMTASDVSSSVDVTLDEVMSADALARVEAGDRINRMTG